ncbi:hypothetical protein EZS27_020403, partial [termite gut metagenome]
MIINVQPNGNYRLQFKYRHSFVEKLKETIDKEGRRFNPMNKSWEVYSSHATQLARFVKSVEAYEKISWENAGAAPKRRQEEAEIIYEVPPLPELQMPHGLKIEPYPYQLQGIAAGLKMKRFLNTDRPGLGKTIQSIATVNLADACPCLVICPATLKINWEREWNRFTDKKATVLSDSIRDTWSFFWQTGLYQIFIVNYESLKKYFVSRIKKAERWTLRDVEFRQEINLFKSVIIDESHRVKSAAVQQSKFCKGIAAGKEYVLELTGTPVVNKPKDLIAQLSILNRLEDLGGYKSFVERYCSGPREASNLNELGYKLRSNCLFGREKEDVLRDLPEKVRQVLTCEIDNRKEYNDAEKDLISYLKKYKEADDEKIANAIRGEVMVRISVLRNISARG